MDAKVLTFSVSVKIRSIKIPVEYDWNHILIRTESGYVRLELFSNKLYLCVACDQFWRLQSVARLNEHKHDMIHNNHIVESTTLLAC